MIPRLSVIFLILGISMGGYARGQSIETLVMPGDVVQSHADVESECSSCHVMFDRDAQDELCVACHEDVGADIQRSGGFHGLFPEVSSSACASCHTDHEGRDAIIVEFDESSFDHGFTDFPLFGAHAEVLCTDCHLTSDKYRDSPADCISCHADDDPHENFLGDQCTDCHTTENWNEIRFDHETTGYSLIGGHLEPACTDCHQDQTFQYTPTACYGCHADDDVHNGRSGQQCDSCHNPVTWSDSSFDHSRDTTFALGGSHGELVCNDCHSDELFSDQLETGCVSCHLDDDEHNGHFGIECGDCHSDTLWTDLLFKHDRDTTHALLGAHEAIECESCHVEPIYDVSLQTGCNDCHAPDDPHKGEQGVACHDCHNEISWADDIFFDHDLTLFPLLGAHAEAICNDCHESQVFRDAPEACIDCHAEDDPHESRFSDDCGSCHNPVDWDAWQFDHDMLTGFPLDGAHRTVSCDGCHRQPLAEMEGSGNRCGDCHRSDDIHDGEFGSNCDRCHSSDNFRDVRSIQ